jgi:hypothetical protein
MTVIDHEALAVRQWYQELWDNWTLTLRTTSSPTTTDCTFRERLQLSIEPPRSKWSPCSAAHFLT